MEEPKDYTPITRKQLYDEIWSTPMTKVSQKYGFSDVGFANVCDEWRIPRPPRGYWAKKQNGHRVRKARLPTIQQGDPIVLHYRRDAEVGPQPPSAVDLQKRFEKLPENHIQVSDQLDDPHPLVAAAIQVFTKAKADEHGILVSSKRGHLPVAASPANLDRALRVMDALIKGLERRDLKVTIGGRDVSRTIVTVLDEKIGFGLYEDLMSVEREPTKQEKEDDDFWKRVSGKRPPTRYRRTASGRLVLKILDGHGVGRTWGDRGDRRVEQFLNSFVVGLYRVAEVLKKDHIEAERHRLESEERERQREIERIRREDLANLQREEEKRFKALEDNATRWRRAQRLKRFIEAVNECFTTDRSMPPELGQWLAWAGERIRCLDPLENVEACAHEVRLPLDWRGWFEQLVDRQGNTVIPEKLCSFDDLHFSR